MVRVSLIGRVIGGFFGMAVVISAPAAQTVLTLSHYGTVENVVHATAERFQDLVEVGSNGALQIEIHPDNELGSAPSVLQDVRLGTIDIATVANPYFSAFEPEMNVFDLPFLFKSRSHAYRVLDGEIGRAILDKLEQHDLKGLAVWEIGFRNLTNNVRPIRTPADVAGLKIRTAPNPAHIRAFELLGAEPVPINFTELHAALESGAVDGQDNPSHHIYASGLHQVQKHLSVTRHAYTVAPLVMNLTKFNGLSEELRVVLMTAALEAARFQREQIARLDDNALALMEADGVDVLLSPDVAAFRDAISERVREDYVANHGDGMLQRIDELR